MSARRALITGITGQDGSFLAELLLEKGYSVVGTIRGKPTDPLGCSEHLRGHLSLLAADLEQQQSWRAAVAEVEPDELYRLAAPSFVPHSWQHPAETLRTIAGSTASLLEAVREHSRDTRTFVAASGAMFGDTPESPQRESTPCRPQSPYATAKLAAHQLVGELRVHDGLFACSGSLSNHTPEGGGSNKAGASRGGCPWRPGRGARLVLRRRHHAGRMADPSAGRSQRLRSRKRRAAHRCPACGGRLLARRARRYATHPAR